MTPYYQDELVTLYHGDCRDVLHSVAPFSEVLLTDPPYNVGKDYGQHNDLMAPTDYIIWCREWFDVVRALL